jgi:hypothetical protein
MSYYLLAESLFMFGRGPSPRSGNIAALRGDRTSHTGGRREPDDDADCPRLPSWAPTHQRRPHLSMRREATACPDCRCSRIPVVPENPIHAIRAMRQNQLIIRRDDCDASWAWDVCRQPVQVAAATRARECLSSASAQYCAEACTTPSAFAWRRPSVVGMDDLALAKPARFIPRRPA